MDGDVETDDFQQTPPEYIPQFRFVVVQPQDSFECEANHTRPTGVTHSLQQVRFQQYQGLGTTALQQKTALKLSVLDCSFFFLSFFLPWFVFYYLL